MSILCAGFQRRASPTRKSTLSILFSCAFVSAVEIATGSRSMATTCSAPKHFADRARIPLPVPRSTIDQPAFHCRVSCSSRRSDSAVVAWSPVPKAAPAGMKMWERPLCRDTRDAEVPPTLKISNRFPILSGLLSCARANRFSQSRGNFLPRPPNSLTSFCAVRDLQTISNCNRLRPGLEIIASPPRARACNVSS